MSDENAAALKVQNLQRKKEARKAVDARRALKAEQDAADEEVKRAEASRRLGAGARGYKQRREAQKQRVAESSAATKMQATFRGKAERDGGDAAARRARLKADPEAAAAEYARKHGLHDLFGMLGQQLVAEKPEDPRAFLVGALEKLAAAGSFSSPLNFFSDDEIETLFSMYDITGRGLTSAQAREALDAIGLEAVATPPAPVDLAAFKACVPAA
jgi:hypothetical protein